MFEDAIILKFYEDKGINWTDIKNFEKEGHFKALLKYTAQTDIKLVKY
jgi:hypothetical protein